MIILCFVAMLTLSQVVMIYTVSGKKRPPPKQNAVKCTVHNTIQ